MSKLKVGDIVILNSGGPLMTVVKINKAKDETKVTWFNEELDKFSSTFPSKALEKFEEEDDWDYYDTLEEVEDDILLDEEAGVEEIGIIENNNRAI